MRQVLLVAGLGYGDEGKGATVDFLADKFKSPLVVRYNGGGQAAHNVFVGDKYHTFAQFGAGTFAGAATLLSQYMLVNPITALSEASALQGLGITPFEKFYVHRDAVVTTPFHVAANRLAELYRYPTTKHGSCGMGIGDTRADEFAHPVETIRVGDLANEAILMDKLKFFQDKKARQWAGKIKRNHGNNAIMARELDVLTDSKWIARCLDYFGRFYRHANVVDSAFLAEYLEEDETVIFEGAQGVLLDQDYGFQPHTTWTSTTFQNALALLGDSDIPVQRIGVTRALMTRHGAGPLMGENQFLSTYIGNADRNKHGDYQGSFRVAPLDFVALDYAKKVIGELDGVVVNHLDMYRRLIPPYVDTYLCYDSLVSESLFDFEDGVVRAIKPPTTEEVKDVNATFARQQNVTDELNQMYPIFKRGPKLAEAMASTIGDRLGVPVAGVSFGKARSSRRWDLE